MKRRRHEKSIGDSHIGDNIEAYSRFASQMMSVCVLFLLSGCLGHLHIVERNHCSQNMPAIVREQFSSNQAKSVWSDINWSIIKRNHADLSVSSSAYLRSELYGWKQYIRYEYPFLIYENEGYYLLRVASYLDWTQHIFRSRRDLWMVLNKQTGEVLRTLDLRQSIKEYVIHKDTLYLKLQIDSGFFEYNFLEIGDFTTAVTENVDLSMFIRSGKLEKIKDYITLGDDINQQDFDGNTLLHSSVIYGQKEITQFLLDQGANVSAVNEDGRTPLYYAVKSENPQLIRILLENGADPDSWDTCSKSETSHYTRSRLIEYCVKYGTDEMFDLFIEFGASIDGESELLLIAAEYGRKHVVETLIKTGVQVDIADYKGTTALQAASECNKFQVVHLLIKSSADVNHQNDAGQTALHLACSQNNLRIVRYLIKSGANVNELDIRGKTPLHYCKRTSEQLVSLLLNKGADPTIVDNDGNLPQVVKTW